MQKQCVCVLIHALDLCQISVHIFIFIRKRFTLFSLPSPLPPPTTFYHPPSRLFSVPFLSRKILFYPFLVPLNRNITPRISPNNSSDLWWARLLAITSQLLQCNGWPSVSATPQPPTTTSAKCLHQCLFIAHQLTRCADCNTRNSLTNTLTHPRHRWVLHSGFMTLTHTMFTGNVDTQGYWHWATC